MKRIIITLVISGIAVFISILNAYSFLDEIEFYWKSFAEALVISGIVLLLPYLFKKKWILSRHLLIAGLILILAGLSILIFVPKQYSNEHPEGVYLLITQSNSMIA